MFHWQTQMGKRRVALGVTADGNPLVGLQDENEQPRVAMVSSCLPRM